jgi:4-carboxymuconolactone decarboxylase
MTTGVSMLPGFGELQDEMLFGRIWSRQTISREDRMLATLAALTSKQHLPQLSSYVGAALHIGMSPRLISEIILHCAIYSGLPTAENSLRAIAHVFEENNIQKLDYTLEEFDLDTLSEMGESTMRALHAESATGGYAAPESAANELYATAIQYLYGEIWNRPGPTLRQRMICSICCFTALQLHSQQRKWFVSAQKTVGLTRAEILEIIAQTAHYSGFPSALNALVIADEVLT